jgi:hypothetical protein
MVTFQIEEKELIMPMAMRNRGLAVQEKDVFEMPICTPFVGLSGNRDGGHRQNSVGRAGLGNGHPG